MAREDLHFRLRIPEELKGKIEESASENRRSMTAEIIARLEQSFHPLITNVRESGDMYAELGKIVERTIRLVRDEERKQGLSPLPYDPEGEE